MGFPVRSDSVRRWMQTVLGETSDGFTGRPVVAI